MKTNTEKIDLEYLKTIKPNGTMNIGNFIICDGNYISTYWGKERRDCDIKTNSKGDLMMKMVMIKEIDEWLDKNKVKVPHEFLVLRKTNYSVENQDIRLQLEWDFKMKSVPKKIQNYLKEIWEYDYKNELRPDDWKSNEEWEKTNPFRTNYIFSYVGLKEETLIKNHDFMEKISGNKHFYIKETGELI